ncbi:tRNA (cytidine(34)-2'-O)-methyltransferase [Helicobacter trogontum]|uniref:Putative tRNA (cytidine(34)-2'-O)-methyltransferase n=1 Tax=Helicobacter trogontum TaxID=50960 RepID=A0A4U8TG38_9HELI|nr:tRNA (cytidine(34)-2'-O)-methyltransferase [Helicobacter trogontum]MCI5785863.1 tRNA (cytidine(34)-2'-O)-methyltransferase [Helicobacter trogontum]MDY5184862.1 tRNA (cytidine(34)-2'-O)-methyltransferase [Helicobacter trogontum]TLD99075.1 tRNA (cytidine(34)-2'-O)-methyltransferase [Helicobacter trogontum]
MQSLFHIVLVEPQIPQNTGNIGRLCVAAHTTLHLIHPLGFSTKQKDLKRAGLDYWQYLEVYEWNNLESFWQTYVPNTTHFFFSTKASKVYFDANLKDGGFLYFGREDAGLPPHILESYANQVYKIPMQKGVRSINLATSVGAVLYEGVRQSCIYERWK